MAAGVITVIVVELQTVSVTVELPTDVLALLDSIAKTQLETRSHYVRTAVLEKLRQQRPKDLAKILESRTAFSTYLDKPQGNKGSR